MVDWAKKYEGSLRNLAEILLRRVSTGEPSKDALETAKTAYFWYAAGRRDGMIENSDVTSDDYHEVLSVDEDEIFRKALDDADSARMAEAEQILKYCRDDVQILEEVANNLAYCRGGFTHIPYAEHLYTDTDSVKYTGHPEPLTDKEQRIFLSAMDREEKVCKEVDAEVTREPYEDCLVRVCKEIIRKVKKSLWT